MPCTLSCDTPNARATPITCEMRFQRAGWGMKNGRREISPLMRGAFAETFSEQGHGQGAEAHPFALGALGEPAMQRFRRAQLPFAAIAFGRFDRGRRDRPAGLVHCGDPAALRILAVGD